MNANESEAQDMLADVIFFEFNGKCWFTKDIIKMCKTHSINIKQVEVHNLRLSIPVCLF